ncbi:MAG: esterase [Deltaproteobacteria bacterium]|nr:esterase [Deltaproteobacteria bacterium]
MTARIENLVIDSAVLAGNPLGDPARRAPPVWLPPSYDSSPSRRFPVIYWLAGFTSTGASLFQGTPWQPPLGERLNRLMTSGQMGEAIVVAPDCFTRFGGSQYLDSPATGLYETHVCQELIPAVDAKFRTIRHANARGIGGKSSGGFGALVLAMRHPDLFCAVASHAGDAYFEVSVLRDIPTAARTLRRHHGISGFLRHFDAAVTKKSDDISTMMMLAMSAAYAPSPGAPDGFLLPFDPDTGELVMQVWRRFKAWDPAELLASHADALRGMRLVYLDAGTRDEWGLDLAARLMATRMRRLGITVDHQEFDDGHMNTAYRYDVSLPKMASALAPATGAVVP